MMTNVEFQAPAAGRTGGWKVDASRGGRVGRVSSEWMTRPADERFLSLQALMAAVESRHGRSRERTIESAAVEVEASPDDPARLTLRMPDSDEPFAPTHWSFGQLAGLVGAPAAYLRQLPAGLAAANLRHGLAAHRSEPIKLLEAADEIDDGSGSRMTLRAVTGPDYGRIPDHELVAAVRRIAGDGVGDTRWKVPGVLDWGTAVYDPTVPVSPETTTLYASDRDVFLFLVDDLHPIEAGRLPNGEPDLFFRGFYCWNSEVGARTLGIASFYLRAVCQNRNLWGVEEFSEITIRHSKHAAGRFALAAAPALARFADSSPLPFAAGVRAARERIVARSDEERVEFLRTRGFSKAETASVVAKVIAEEGHPPASVFDFAQGITALARAKPHQDARLALEARARTLMAQAG
jgi:hypothetical protein